MTATAASVNGRTIPAPASPPEFDPRTPPHDLSAEQCVLGALLLSVDAIDEVAQILAAGDFYRPAHQIIYTTIRRLHDRGEPADAVTVHAELTRNGEADRCGQASYLHTLISTVPTAANAGYYAGIVLDRRKARTLIEVGTGLVRRGYDVDPGDADEALDRAQQDLLTGLDGEDQADVPAPDVAFDAEALEWLAADPADDPARIPLPYMDLDRLLGGLRPGQLVIVGARPAIGKSVVALDIARHAALRAGAPTYVASLEMSRRDLLLRLAAAEGRIPLDRLVNRNLDDGHWEQLAKVRQKLADHPHLFIDDNPNVSLGSLRAALRRMARQPCGPARLVVIDYLQLMQARGNAENRQVAVAELSRELKLLAKEMDVPVVVLSQLNRASEQRTDKRPGSADLRESGALEQDADVVVLLHREDAYDKESPRAGEMELIVAKQRSGPTSTVTVVFQGHYARAADMA